ncbi:MoaD/ThiS family protein [candidate division KSB1 bacterium]|nr:MoaD/ThiS family protein [candidate division KSB1 bacterium]MCH8286259.1 MoaD/ThiS family protein [candidate division KSB1 bacterium]
MKIKLRFFAICRELAGQEYATIDLPESCDRERLHNEIGTLFPRLSELLPQVAIALNNEYAPRDGNLKLNDGDEISLIPPVSGG